MLTRTLGTAGHDVVESSGEVAMVRRKRRAYILDDSEVREIRQRGKAGESTRAIARLYGVSHIAVHNILRGVSRKEVK